MNKAELLNFMIINRLLTEAEKYCKEREKIATEYEFTEDAKKAYTKLAYASTDFTENLIGIVLEQF